MPRSHNGIKAALACYEGLVKAAIDRFTSTPQFRGTDPYEEWSLMQVQDEADSKTPLAKLFEEWANVALERADPHASIAFMICSEYITTMERIAWKAQDAADARVEASHAP